MAGAVYKMLEESWMLRADIQHLNFNNYQKRRKSKW